MNQFKTLYVYELRKIFKRKIVWITMGILMAVAIFMGVAEIVSSTYAITNEQGTVEISGFEYWEEEKKNGEALNGKSIDDELLAGVKEAYRGLYVSTYDTESDELTTATKTSIATSVAEIDDSESKEEINRQILAQRQYREIYHYVYRIMGEYDAIHTISEESLYQERSNYQQLEMGWQGLTEDEKAYWQEKEETIEKPFVYGFAEGWERVLEEFLSLNFMLVLAIAICLSTVFSEEHARKTDQLILCSRNGRKTLFFAKISAGVTFGVAGAVILLVLAMVSTLAVYGAGGLDTALQIFAPMSSRNLTIGQAVLLMVVVYLVASILYSIMAMFLSETMKNSVAVMGLMTGCLIFTMIASVPERFRVLSQMYDLIPTVLAGVWNFSDYRLVKIFGIYLTNYQIAPIIYAVISAVLICCVNRIYKKYQVSGR